MQKKSSSRSGPARLPAGENFRSSLGKGGFFTPRALTTLLLCAAASSIVTGTLLAYFRSEAPTNGSQRTLTFAERVGYQRAIEDVYWRHRIWPKKRPDPKPALDAVMSQAQVEKKVADYLRKSQALEDHWQRPITAEQLQAEMDRMARHTKQPEVLRELFAALGNNSFVIAECLARPALAERLVADWYAYDQSIHSELRQHAEADLQRHPTVEQMKQMSGKYNEIELVKSDTRVTVRQAHRLPTEQLAGGAPAVQRPHSTRTVMLNSREWDETVQKLAVAFERATSQLTNGTDGLLGRPYLSARPAIASYQSLPTRKLSPLQEDETCYYATAIIENSQGRLKLARVTWPKEPLESWLAGAENQMPRVTIAGITGCTLPAIGTGGCSDDIWTNMYAVLAGRNGHTAVWTGSEMIIWGGADAGTAYNTGGRYNPSTDTWVAVSMTNAPAGRYFHTAVWTGSEMIVWGGQDANPTDLNSGGRYNPATDSWTPTSTDNAPQARHSQTAVWTSSEMIIWGGCFGNGCTPLNTGGRYNPSTDSWTATSTINAPSARVFHTAVWTGSEMIIWGGSDLNTGGRYNPNTDSWSATSLVNAPAAREQHAAVWTGSEMIVWGGSDLNQYLNTGGRFNPETDSWTNTATDNTPAGREGPTAIWTGTEMIVWGGFFYDGSNHYVNSGGRYNPSGDSWIATSTTNAPDGREIHTAVWTDSEMIIWGGYTYPEGNLNSGGRYNPSTDSWIATLSTPTQRWFHTAVWTGSEMIVWGGQDQFANVKRTGGRYDPATDTWAITNVTDAPSERELHTAVWTGTEMIIWGGLDEFLNLLNTGARYNPGADTWTAVNTANAPAGRYSHTAVWTGSEMVIWGGFGNTTGGAVNTGGKYNPDTDSWVATGTTNAPSARAGHGTVWTGSEMIVWGGCSYSGSYQCANTGGRYNPGADSWTATSTANAPDARWGHTAVWTGSQMIIWAGYYPSVQDFDTGGRYNPSTDSWTATTTIDVPTARFHQAGVWSGTEMIIWGGEDFLGNIFNTGGRYNPETDSWVATSTTNAPTPRFYHTAAWAGIEMIVWGGANDTEFFNTGGRYCAQAGPPSPTPTPTASPTTTATPTPTLTATPTPSATPRPSPTPRLHPTARPRPTPPPRPALPTR